MEVQYLVVQRALRSSVHAMLVVEGVQGQGVGQQGAVILVLPVTVYLVSDQSDRSVDC